MTSGIDSNSQINLQYEPQKALLQAFLMDIPAQEVPCPWPSPSTTMAWSGQELQSRHLVHLLDSQRCEIAEACATFIASGQSLDKLDKLTFPLPLLADKLATLRGDLHHGLGISVLRGVDVSCLSMSEAFVTFAGLASHVSQQRGRQSGGKAIVHITDLSETAQTPLPAPYRNGNLPFHTDPAADVVAMFVIQPSAEGGEGTFCPVASIYNHLAASRPELLNELAKPDWIFERPPTGAGNFCRRPVMFLGQTSGAPEMVFSRGSLIRSAHNFRSAGIPQPTQHKVAALDAVHFTATANACRIKYEKGDVLFFNNRRILHGREAFQDNGNEKRHMLRLWLRDEEFAGIPPASLGEVWEDTFATWNRAGDADMNDDRWPIFANK